MLFDMHVHSFFSDAQREFDQVIEALVDNGVKIVGIADHVFPGALYRNPKRFGKERRLHYCHSASLLRYRARFLKLMDRKYRKKIRILVGGEIDILPAGNLALPRGITPADFDYLMVVKHHTFPKTIDFPFKKRPDVYRWLYARDPCLRMNERLWEKELYAAFDRFRPDIFGHPQEGMPRFLSAYKLKRLATNARLHGVALELNHVTNHPLGVALLDAMHEAGTIASIGSDFHGFQPDIHVQLNHIHDMIAMAEKYDVDLLDPSKFLPENKTSRAR